MLLRFGYDWLHGALTEALEGRQARWQALLDQSRQLIDQIVQLLDTLGSRQVSIPATRDARSVRADAVAVIEYLKGGGKWTEFGLLTPKAVKDRTYFRDEITVDGQPADTHERLYMVCITLTLRSHSMLWKWPGLITVVCHQVLNRGYAWQLLRSMSAVLALLWIMPRCAKNWVAI